MTENPRGGRAAWAGDLFRLLVENVVDLAIFVVDPAGVIVLWSHGAEGLLGYREDEALGRSAERFYTPEDLREDVPGRVMREALLTGRGADERWQVRKDGSRFWAAGVMTPVRDESGELRGFARIMRDRTEWWQADRARSESRSRLAAVLETALDAIITMDHQGRVVEFNPAAETTFGYDRGAVVGRDLCDLIIPPSLRTAHREGLARYLATGEGPVLGRRIEIVAIRAGGEEFPVELAITRISTDGPPQFTAFVRDITDRKRAEAMIAEQVRLAEFGREVGLALTQAGSLSDMLGRCAGAAVRHLDVAFARI